MSAPVLNAMTFRIGYADTDPAGILYYAAWFPWMERVQTEWFWLHDLRQDQLVERIGAWWVTCHAECDYLVPVHLFDEIRIEVRLGRIGRASFDMEHRMVRTEDDVTVGQGLIRLVTVAPEGGAVPLPAALRDRLEGVQGVRDRDPAGSIA